MTSRSRRSCRYRRRASVHERTAGLPVESQCSRVMSVRGGTNSPTPLPRPEPADLQLLLQKLIHRKERPDPREIVVEHARYRPLRIIARQVETSAGEDG